MFAFNCPNHQSRVLIWSSDIEGVVNSGAGLGMAFHCSCGYRGLLIEGAGVPEVIVPLDESVLATAA